MTRLQAVIPAELDKKMRAKLARTEGFKKGAISILMQKLIEDWVKVR